MSDVREKAIEALWRAWADWHEADYAEPGSYEFSEDDYHECVSAAREIVAALEAAGLTITASPPSGTVRAADVMASIEREIADASRYALKDHRTPLGAWDDEAWVDDLRNGITQAIQRLATATADGERSEREGTGK